MADSIFALKEKERREFFQAASAKTGRLDTLIEKDVWVVWALSALYESPLGAHLVFKGGTSLSKGYNDLIKRFSEDVDLTYDIRELTPDLLTENWQMREEPLPDNPAEAKKVLDKIRKKKLPDWIKASVLPVLEARKKADKVNVTFRLEDEKLFIDYGKAEQEYVKPNVQLEFGARSTGEPAEVKAVSCYAEAVSGDVLLPKANPRIMVPRRTFWEKATAVHVFCRQSKPIADRLARHWYDLDQLDRAKVSDEAIVDKPPGEAGRQLQDNIVSGEGRARRADRLFRSGHRRAAVGADGRPSQRAREGLCQHAPGTAAARRRRFIRRAHEMQRRHRG